MQTNKKGEQRKSIKEILDRLNFIIWRPNKQRDVKNQSPKVKDRVPKVLLYGRWLK